MSARRTTQIRFDADVYERLVVESKARTVSVNWIVNRLIRESLDRLIPVEEVRLMLRQEEQEARL